MHKHDNYEVEKNTNIAPEGIHYHGPTIKAILDYPEYLVGRVLDLGCSSGYHLFVTAESDLVTSAAGIDINQKKIDNVVNLRRPGKDDHVEFVCGNIVELDTFFDEDEFDSIETFHTLEHWWPSDLPVIFSQIKRVLKHNGHVMVIIPLDHNHDTPGEHHTWWTSKTLQELFESFNFETVFCRDYTHGQILAVFKNIKE